MADEIDAIDQTRAKLYLEAAKRHEDLAMRELDSAKNFIVTENCNIYGALLSVENAGNWKREAIDDLISAEAVGGPDSADEYVRVNRVVSNKLHELKDLLKEKCSCKSKY